MRNEQRWPDYAQNVVAHGVLSSLSVPLPFQGVTIGALNTYGGRPRVVDDSDLELAEEVAAWVAIAVGNAEAAARTSEDLTQLRTAMMSRALIEQAKGVLMERHKITEDEAFTMLTHASQRTKKSLRDVAQSLSEPARSPVETDADPARFHHLLAHSHPPRTYGEAVNSRACRASAALNADACSGERSTSRSAA
jgi:GAF domain-containing protein